MDVVNDLHMGGSTSTEDVNLSQKRKMPKRKKQGNAVECEGPDFSLDNSSPKMDATINHPLDESPALPNFLSCQIIVEFNSTKQNEKGKRKKTTHNPIEGNNSGYGTSENTFSSKADGRQVDDTEITRSDLCCAGEQIELNTDNINEQRSMTTSSAVDIHVEQLETNGRQLDHAEITRNDQCCAGDVSDLSLDTVRDGHLKISQFSLDRSVSGNRKKKLLILDVNGLLADFVSVNVTRTRYRREPEPDFVLKGKKVYKRPFCEDFLQFCFDRFHVGVWSSRAKSNVHEAIKFLLGKSASKLLFCWNQSHCTTTEFTTVENIYKPLVLKELRKLWEKEEPDLPWEKGEFNESNTLLLDDSPYKALMNPMHSAIFPYSYRYYNTRDSELGPGGDLRVYLEGLAVAENVRNYVSENPFGQRPIREANPSWGYYRRVIESVQRSQKARPSSTG